MFEEPITKPVLLARDDLEPAMLRVVGSYEQRFDIRFTRFLLVTRPVLADYIGTGLAQFKRQVTLVSRTQPAVISLMTQLTLLANNHGIGRVQRILYRDILEKIYRLFPIMPVAPSVVVAPQREGAILARRLGWLLTGHMTPHLKRMPFEGGLLVGCDDEMRIQTGSAIHIVDGALATGVTAMTILSICQPATATIFCAHATAEGLASLLRFSREIKTKLSCVVGMMSGSLNSHFYAVIPEDPGRLCVGDLGDMIAPLDLDVSG